MRFWFDIFMLIIALKTYIIIIIIYYLIVYTVLLVQFPKKNLFGPPHQQNQDPPLATHNI